MTSQPHAVDLLSLMSLLPDGISDTDLVQSKPPIPEILKCKATLVCTSLAYVDHALEDFYGVFLRYIGDTIQAILSINQLNMDLERGPTPLMRRLYEMLPQINDHQRHGQFIVEAFRARWFYAIPKLDRAMDEAIEHFRIVNNIEGEARLYTVVATYYVDSPRDHKNTQNLYHQALSLASQCNSQLVQVMGLIGLAAIECLHETWEYQGGVQRTLIPGPVLHGTWRLQTWHAGLEGSVYQLGLMNIEGEIHQLRTEYGEARQIQEVIISHTSPVLSLVNYAYALVNLVSLDLATRASTDIVWGSLYTAADTFQRIQYPRGLSLCEVHIADLNLREGDAARAHGQYMHTFASVYYIDNLLACYCLAKLADSTTPVHAPPEVAKWAIIFLAFVLRPQARSMLRIHQALLSLGNILAQLGMDNEALSVLKVALEGFTWMDIHQSRAECMRTIGDVLCRQGDTVKACTFWTEARPLFKRSSQAKAVFQIDERLAESAQQQEASLEQLSKSSMPTLPLQQLFIEEAPVDEEVENVWPTTVLHYYARKRSSVILPRHKVWLCWTSAEITPQKTKFRPNMKALPKAVLSSAKSAYGEVSHFAQIQTRSKSTAFGSDFVLNRKKISNQFIPLHSVFSEFTPQQSLRVSNSEDVKAMREGEYILKIKDVNVQYSVTKKRWATKSTAENEGRRGKEKGDATFEQPSRPSGHASGEVNCPSGIATPALGIVEPGAAEGIGRGVEKAGLGACAGASSLELDGLGTSCGSALRVVVRSPVDRGRGGWDGGEGGETQLDGRQALSKERVRYLSRRSRRVAKCSYLPGARPSSQAHARESTYMQIRRMWHIPPHVTHSPPAAAKSQGQRRRDSSTWNPRGALRRGRAGEIRAGARRAGGDPGIEGQEERRGSDATTVGDRLRSAIYLAGAWREVLIAGRAPRQIREYEDGAVRKMTVLPASLRCGDAAINEKARDGSAQSRQHGRGAPQTESASRRAQRMSSPPPQRRTCIAVLTASAREKIAFLPALYVPDGTQGGIGDSAGVARARRCPGVRAACVAHHKSRGGGGGGHARCSSFKRRTRMRTSDVEAKLRVERVQGSQNTLSPSEESVG
ncbi:hypothetical protein DFH08DRAFT_817739 [Mycena albidolilacea]|uniref:Uncharacterized protein n=1 Tax=Mycena albidolilacea TaxID=1033008 RepID=A0AAD6ZHL4_9AGAR|nr:hypothetical protein DFH08DRAFT_817739 [Mycena albidolilacea]